MENLNAERIKSDLKHCSFGKDKPTCEGCNYKPWIKPRCFGLLCSNALALVTSQEQRIKELAEENAEVKANWQKLKESQESACEECRAEFKRLTEENERLRAELEQRPPKLIITKLPEKENENV